MRPNLNAGTERNCPLLTKDPHPSNQLDPWEQGHILGGDQVLGKDSGALQAEGKPGFEFQIHLV